MTMPNNSLTASTAVAIRIRTNTIAKNQVKQPFALLKSQMLAGKHIMNRISHNTPDHTPKN